MWWKKSATSQKTVLSPSLEKMWGFLSIHHLVLATPGFIVWIDEDLDIDWKTSQEWDDHNSEGRQKRYSIINRASALESADWDGSDRHKTLNFKRQIAEAVARGLDGDFANAEQMLDKAEEYRTDTLKSLRRRQAVEEQIQIKDNWKACHKLWTCVHYVIGFAALLFSTLVAAKPAALGLSDNITAMFAWLVAFLTALLTFLLPDKKADKYIRAWSILNSQITRYNTDESYTVNDVLDAYHRGESIIFENAATSSRRTKSS